MNKSISPSYYNKEGVVSCTTVQLALCQDMVGTEAYYMGCIVKYLYRFQQKNGVEDLRKALTYLEALIGDCSLDEIHATRGQDEEYERKWSDRRTQSSDEDTFPTL